MIIVIGHDEEYHARHVLENIKSKNIDVKYLDSRIFPELSWSLGDEKDFIILEGEKIYLKDVQSVYWRWYFGVVDCPTDIIYREKTSALESMLYSLNDICFNSLYAVELHRKKSYQSYLMLQNNIRIPKTLITNSAEALEDFYFSNNKSVIFKPVRGGAYTKKMTDEDLERKHTLVNCPCQLQEFVDGVDIRVYAFDTGEIFAGEILAESLDFREDLQAKINRVELPEKVKADCLKVMQLLGLRYSGIDIRLNKDGEYVFIEANPAPMFYHFEKMTGYPITETLVKNLNS